MFKGRRNWRTGDICYICNSFVAEGCISSDVGGGGVGSSNGGVRNCGRNG